MGSKKAKQTATFNDTVEALLNTVYALVFGMKSRLGGAQNYGADGLFVCAVESLHTARSTKNLEDFLKSAAYSTAAALVASGAWDYPVVEPKADEEKGEEEKAE